MDTTSSGRNQFGIDPVFAFLIFLTVFFWSIVFFRPLFFGGDDWFVFYHLATKKSTALLDYLFTSHQKHFYPFIKGFISIELTLFGLHYFPFQVVSLLIHIAVTALLYVLLSIHVSDKRVLLPSVAFFSINAAYYPQTVGWVMGQSTMISLLFVILALLSMELYRDKGRIYLIVSLWFCILSAFSSGSGLITPLVVLVYVWLFHYRTKGVPSERGRIAAPALALVLAQIALIILYFLVLKREDILSGNLYFFSIDAIVKITKLVLAGVLALLFTSLGGKALILLFDINPLQLLNPLSLPYPLIAVLCLISFLALLAAVYSCIGILRNRDRFKRFFSRQWPIALFGIFFILIMYAIRAVGRMDTHGMVDFMVSHQYRYEATFGLALVVSFILGYILKILLTGRTKAFVSSLIALSIASLVILNLPAVWYGGQEYPQDRDFVTAFRTLLMSQTENATVRLPNIPYTFHDDIKSTFLISDIQKMLDRNRTGVVFKDDMSVQDIRDKKIRRFYLTYFPQQLIR